MKRLVIAVGLAASVGACVPTTYTAVASTCSEYVGRPISERIAALGSPKAIYRVSPTQLGYVFETSVTTYQGGYTYYTVNYLVGSQKHRTPIYPVTTTCLGTFIVHAPSDTIPMSERIIVDVL